ncbi:MAG TPA: hypothetical protein VGF55_27900 [Gemmataceae bacterium]
MDEPDLPAEPGCAYSLTIIFASAVLGFLAGRVFIGPLIDSPGDELEALGWFLYGIAGAAVGGLLGTVWQCRAWHRAARDRPA